MAETRKDDQDRFIDETLSLFQNAISETKTALPPVWFGRAVEPKDVPPSEPPAQEKRAASLIGQAVSFVRTVAGFEPRTAETASPSLQPPVAKQVREKPVRDARSDPLIDQALSMVAIVSIDEPKVVEAASPTPTVLKTEAAIPLSQQLPMKQFSPKERLDMDRADIRRRVAIFREHQQRFQREREEYYAATMAKVRAAQCTSGTGIRDN